MFLADDPAENKTGHGTMSHKDWCLQDWCKSLAQLRAEWPGAAREL